MATKASLDIYQAINKTFRAGSNERKALTKFVTSEGISVNLDREAARVVVKSWAAVLTTIRQTWGL